MTLPELHEQQQREIEELKANRDKAWATLHKEHQEITAAFGNKENLPEDSRKRMDAQIASYHREWATDTGEHFQAIRAQHEKQREQLGGKPAPAKQAQEPKNDNDQLTERQIEMQKIIAQQQAIRRRNQERKRHR